MTLADEALEGSKPSSAHTQTEVPHTSQNDSKQRSPKKSRSAGSDQHSSTGIDSSVKDQTDVPPAKKRSYNSKATKSLKCVEKESEQIEPVIEWPAFFSELERTFKALNTTLSFFSSRRYLAVSFDQILASVSKALRRPQQAGTASRDKVQLQEIAQLKALLPDLIKFAYTPKTYLNLEPRSTKFDKILQTSKYGASSQHDAAGTSPNKYVKPKQDEDFYAPAADALLSNDRDQVLVLEFMDAPVKKPKPNPTFSFAPPITPQETMKLIEKRNVIFRNAVNDLLSACQETGDDPAQLVIQAALDHIPVDPYAGMESVAQVTLASHKKEDGGRASIESILEEFKTEPHYREQFVHERKDEAKEAIFADLTRPPLPDAVQRAVQGSKKISRFYSHQAEAIDLIWQGNHVMVCTPTASGKSLVYQVPIMDALYKHGDTKGLFIYPTKALAQDQVRGLRKMLGMCSGLQHIEVSTFDGDTPKSERASIQASASVIFTNFDTLHHAILPREESWRTFFKNLQFVVVDELHFYHGLMGSHVAFILRRLRRICAAVGNHDIQFVSCSATIGNPLEHFQRIFGVQAVSIVQRDGAPTGIKHFALYRPPPIDASQASGPRVNSLSETSSLLRYLVARDVRTIVFCKNRKVCELLMKRVQTDLSLEGNHKTSSKIHSYRSGYNPEDRRKIEMELFSGQLMAVIATSALELGIDVGALDAVITHGFPYSVASLRQQIGRAGRSHRDSLGIIVGEMFAIDAHYLANPTDIFTKPADDLILDLENEVILGAHLQCAAHELPISSADTAYFGSQTLPIAQSKLSSDQEGWYHPHPAFMPFPAGHVSIRGSEEENYKVITDNRLLEEVPVSRALFELYEGGVFMNQGLSYIVNEVSHETRFARVRYAQIDWNTKPRDFTNINADKTLRIRAIKDSTELAYFGNILISTHVFGYFKLKNLVLLDVVDIDTPPYERVTNGLWFDVPPNAMHICRVKGINLAEAIHAAQHAILVMLPLFAMSSLGDVGTECKLAMREYASQPTARKRPARLVFYDQAGASNGICAKAFDNSSQLLREALRLLEDCECEKGCMSCIETAACKHGNECLSKSGGLVILKLLNGQEVDLDSVPDQPELDNRTPGETIVSAEPVSQGSDIAVEAASTE